MTLEFNVNEKVLDQELKEQVIKNPSMLGKLLEGSNDDMLIKNYIKKVSPRGQDGKSPLYVDVKNKALEERHASVLRDKETTLSQGSETQEEMVHTMGRATQIQQHDMGIDPRSTGGKSEFRESVIKMQPVEPIKMKISTSPSKGTL